MQELWEVIKNNLVFLATGDDRHIKLYRTSFLICFRKKDAPWRRRFLCLKHPVV